MSLNSDGCVWRVAAQNHGVKYTRCMRILSLALLQVAILAATPCLVWGQDAADQPQVADRTKSRVGVDRRSTASIKIKIGDGYFAIPQNYMSAQLSAEGREGDFIIVDVLLLTAMLPDLEGRTAANEAEILTTRGFGRSVNILLARSRRPPSEALARYKKYAFEDHPHDTIKETDSENVIVARNPGYPGSKTQDVYVQKKTGHYTVCGRVQLPYIKKPVCKHHGENGFITYDISFDRSFIEQRDDIARSVALKLIEWSSAVP